MCSKVVRAAEVTSIGGDGGGGGGRRGGVPPAGVSSFKASASAFAGAEKKAHAELRRLVKEAKLLRLEGGAGRSRAGKPGAAGEAWGGGGGGGLAKADHLSRTEVAPLGGLQGGAQGARKCRADSLRGKKGFATMTMSSYSKVKKF